MKKRTAIIALIASGLLAVLGVACEPQKISIDAPNDTTTHGIAVTGEGKVTGTPDVAILTLGVSTIQPTVAAARDTAATTMRALVDAVKNNGVAEKDVQTTQFNIYPEYDYSQGGNGRLVGYRLTNTVTVKVRDIDKTSDVLDSATAAGGDMTQVQGISFTIDDPSALKDQAREEAVNDAKAHAQTLADTAGVKLGDPISISETSVTPYQYGDTLKALPSTAGGTSTPIEAGELDVDLTVQVIFAID
jgi:uncharacterized protein YggE